MADKEQEFKGLLRFLSGKKEIITVPGVETEAGEIFVPKSITIEDKYFALSKNPPKNFLFEYQEIEQKFRMDLH